VCNNDKVAILQTRKNWDGFISRILIIPALKTVVAIVSGGGESIETSRDSRRRLFEFIENRLINYLQ